MLAALAGAGCGAEKSTTSPCGVDRRTADAIATVTPARGAPAGVQLVNGALRKARRTGSVHFRLTASFDAEVPESYLRSLENGERMVELSKHPLCIVLEGDRTGEGFDAIASIESERKVKRYEVRQARGRLYLRLHGRWFDLQGPFGRFFESETFGALIPGEACVQEESEGCDRVDFGPPLASGRIGRLIVGDVGEHAGTWQLTGRLDPVQFSKFTEDAAPPSTYEPFARKGTIVFSAGKRDGLPREFDFRYDFDRGDVEAHSGSSAGAFTRRRGHVNVRLSGWGEPVDVSTPPHASRPTDAVFAEVFGAIVSAAYLYY